MLVSDPKYLGIWLVSTRNLLDKWELFQILQIFGVFPWLLIVNAVFVVDCPDYLGYLSER